MKLSLALLFALVAYAGDVTVSGRGPAFVLIRGAAWGASDIGAFPSIEQNYIITPSQPSAGLCVQIINNNPTNQHIFATTNWGTNDLLASSFSTTRWNMGMNPPGIIGTFIAAASSFTFWVPTSGTVRIALTIKNTVAAGGSPDTADIFAAQTNLTSCYGSSTITSSQNTTGVTLTEKGARWNVQSSPGAGVQASATVTGPTAPSQRVIDCVTFGAIATGATAASQMTVDVLDGATLIFRWVVGAPVLGIGQAFGLPVSLCGLNLIGTPAQSMTVQFSAALANLAQVVSMTGFNAN